MSTARGMVACHLRGRLRWPRLEMASAGESAAVGLGPRFLPSYHHPPLCSGRPVTPKAVVARAARARRRLAGRWSGVCAGFVVFPAATGRRGCPGRPFTCAGCEGHGAAAHLGFWPPPIDYFVKKRTPSFSLNICLHTLSHFLLPLPTLPTFTLK